MNHRGIEANPSMINALVDMRSLRTSREIQSQTGRVAAPNNFISRSSESVREFFKAINKRAKFEWTEECKVTFGKLIDYLGSSPLLAKSIDGEIIVLYLEI